MARVELKMNGRMIFHTNGKFATFCGQKIQQWESSTCRWSNPDTGKEIEGLKNKSFGQLPDLVDPI
jgi:hypothetical protein